MTESLRQVLIEMLTQVGNIGLTNSNTMLWVASSNLSDKIRRLP